MEPTLTQKMISMLKMVAAINWDTSSAQILEPVENAEKLTLTLTTCTVAPVENSTALKMELVLRTTMKNVALDTVLQDLDREKVSVLLIWMILIKRIRTALR